MFACASIATPACCSTWARVSAAVSAAKSASRIRDREADMFSTDVDRFATTDSKRFWIAPRSAREPLTSVRALSMTRSTMSADRKSTRLNSSHVKISYAVFCLKKKKNIYNRSEQYAVNRYHQHDES